MTAMADDRKANPWLDEMLQLLDEELAFYEKGWLQFREPMLVADAVEKCALLRAPLPLWLCRAVVEIALGRETSHQRHRRAERWNDFERWRTVWDFREGGATWERSYEAASDLLSGTDAAGEPGTMKESYQKVEKAFREGRNILYAIAERGGWEPHAPPKRQQ